MYPFGLIGWAGLLTVLVITSNVLADDTPVAFDTRKQWKWVDQSCDSRIDRLNIAAEEFLEMGDAAYTSLTKGGSTDASRQTLQALFKASSFQAILIRCIRPLIPTRQFVVHSNADCGWLQQSSTHSRGLAPMDPSFLTVFTVMDLPLNG